MLANNRLAARAAVLVSLLVAAMSLSVVPQAVAVTSHKPLNDTRPVGAGPVTVDFPIEYFGLVADLDTRRPLPDRGPAPFGEARFRVGGQWTPWQPVGQDGAQARGQFTGALISVDRADAYQVRGLPDGAHRWRAAAINTTDGPTFVVGHRRPATATAAPACMSRADWGADESMSGWAKGDTQSFSPAQTLTVHHTAGSNDPAQDYAATVRAVYSYHVKSNGWSDIGYQYLIDGNGTVYEGRSAGHTSRSCLYDGGDGSDFAHETGTDHVVTGAHVLNYNTGNVGISVMGCFEPGARECSGTTEPTSAAVDALESELASLSLRHGLDPKGTVHYVNPAAGTTKDVPTISGHRDWADTACPGGTLYAQLPAIRNDVAARTASPEPTYPATVAFTSAKRSVAEDAGVVRLKVVRGGNTTTATSVGYAVTSSSATPGSDFSLAQGTLSFAAGDTTETIPLQVNDDAELERSEKLVVSLSDPGEHTVLAAPSTTTITISGSDQQPDGWISKKASSGYVGDGVYNATGEQQTVKVEARRTTARTFYVRVHNDGNVKNTVSVTGSGARSGFRVKYISGTTDITSEVRSEAGWPVTLRAAEYELVKVKVEVLRGAAHGSRLPVKVTGTWRGDSTRVDAVRAVVQVVR